MNNYIRSNAEKQKKFEKLLSKTLQRTAQEVRDARIKKNLTQVELAEITGINDRTIQMFESGRHWIGLRNYLIICHELDIEFRHFDK